LKLRGRWLFVDEAKGRNVTTLRQFNDDVIRFAFAVVVLRQLCAKAARFCPNDGIEFRIVVRFPAEYLNSNHGFFQFVIFAGQIVLDNEPQKAGKPFVALEPRTPKHAVQLGLHSKPLGLVKRHEIEDIYFFQYGATVLNTRLTPLDFAVTAEIRKMPSMRTIILILIIGSTACALEPVGTWKMNSQRSTFVGDPHPREVTVRIEVSGTNRTFSFEKIGANGRKTIDKETMYLDGKARPHVGNTCSGTHSTRRVDKFTIELISRCSSGQWARFVTHFQLNGDMILDILDVLPNGRRLTRHLVMEKENLR